MWRAPARWLALLTHLPADALSPLHALAPDLARLCGRDVPQPAEITPEATQARLREVLEQLFREQASDASQPVLVLLEDLHWADGGSLALLHALTALADQLPLLIVATFAIFHGYPHGQLTLRAVDPAAFTVGFVVSTGAIHILGIAVGLGLNRVWGGNLVRALGAAIVLAGIYFLLR